VCSSFRIAWRRVIRKRNSEQSCGGGGGGEGEKGGKGGDLKKKNLNNIKKKGHGL